MRIRMVLAFVCVALALAGCESDEPLTASSGNNNNLQVQIVGQATVPTWNVWDWTEDTNGNGVLDQEPDLDGDGRLDSGEDVNHNGILDPGEDRVGDGRLRFDEDFLEENGLLDRAPGIRCPRCEDANLNCVLDAGEDTNGDGILQSEDVDCDGRLDPNEDRNRNGVRDLEDFVEPNGSLDTGIWCEETGLSPMTGNVPVPISGQVLLYRLGNPTPEVLANLGASGGFTGLTPYDTRVFAQLGDRHVALLSGQALGLRAGQQLSAASSRVMHANRAKSPAHATSPTNSTPTNAGLCNVGFDFGVPNLGVPLPLTAQATAGDTVAVRLQIASVFDLIEDATGYGVSSMVLLNGRSLSANGSTGAGLGGSITFSVTVP